MACSCTVSGEGRSKVPCLTRTREEDEKLPHGSPHKIGRWVTNGLGTAPHKTAYVIVFQGGSQGYSSKTGRAAVDLVCEAYVETSMAYPPVDFKSSLDYL
jgi:hypothetical protein